MYETYLAGICNDNSEAEQKEAGMDSNQSFFVLTLFRNYNHGNSSQQDVEKS